MTTLDRLANVELVNEGWDSGAPAVAYRIAGKWEVVAFGAVRTGAVCGMVVRALRAADHGVDTEALRAVPMQDIHSRLRRLSREHERNQRSADFPVPKRMRTTGDWEQFAATYEKAVEACPSSPTRYLADLTGVSYNTLSARVKELSRRARVSA